VIRVLFFAKLREDLGQAEIELPWSDALGSDADLREQLSERDESWRRVLSAENIICAVNQQQADPAEGLSDGDEVAFFPPVTGG
jgi:molybdopterin synthase sulfur carrier subunit